MSLDKFVTSLLEDEIKKVNLTEDALSGYEYEVPKDKEKLLYDFYMSTLLFPPATSGPGAVIGDENLNWTVEYTRNKLYEYLRKELLDAVFFSLSAEIRHIFDADNWNHITSVLENDELDLFRKWATEWAGYEKFKIEPRVSLDRQVRELVRRTESYNPDYFNSYKAALKADPKMKKMVQIYQKLYENAHWKSSFGGHAWAEIAKAWLKLDEAKTPLEKMIWIDHVYDLQHNTDTVFNKIRSFTKDGGYSWIKKALDFKFRIKNPYEMMDKVSYSMKELASYALKAWKNTTYEDYLKANDPNWTKGVNAGSSVEDMIGNVFDKMSGDLTFKDLKPGDKLKFKDDQDAADIGMSSHVGKNYTYTFKKLITIKDAINATKDGVKKYPQDQWVEITIRRGGAFAYSVPLSLLKKIDKMTEKLTYKDLSRGDKLKFKEDAEPKDVGIGVSDIKDKVFIFLRKASFIDAKSATLEGAKKYPGEQWIVVTVETKGYTYTIPLNLLERAEEKKEIKKTDIDLDKLSFGKQLAIKNSISGEELVSVGMNPDDKDQEWYFQKVATQEDVQGLSSKGFSLYPNEPWIFASAENVSHGGYVFPLSFFVIVKDTKWNVGDSVKLQDYHFEHGQLNDTIKRNGLEQNKVYKIKKFVKGSPNLVTIDTAKKKGIQLGQSWFEKVEDKSSSKDTYKEFKVGDKIIADKEESKTYFDPDVYGHEGEIVSINHGNKDINLKFFVPGITKPVSQVIFFGDVDKGFIKKVKASESLVAKTLGGEEIKVGDLVKVSDRWFESSDSGIASIIDSHSLKKNKEYKVIGIKEGTVADVKVVIIENPDAKDRGEKSSLGANWFDKVWEEEPTKATNYPIAVDNNKQELKVGDTVEALDKEEASGSHYFSNFKHLVGKQGTIVEIHSKSPSEPAPPIKVDFGRERVHTFYSYKFKKISGAEEKKREVKTFEIGDKVKVLTANNFKEFIGKIGKVTQNIGWKDHPIYTIEFEDGELANFEGYKLEKAEGEETEKSEKIKLNSPAYSKFLDNYHQVEIMTFGDAKVGDYLITKEEISSSCPIGSIARYIKALGSGRFYTVKWITETTQVDGSYGWWRFDRLIEIGTKKEPKEEKKIIDDPKKVLSHEGEELKKGDRVKFISSKHYKGNYQWTETENPNYTLYLRKEGIIKSIDIKEGSKTIIHVKFDSGEQDSFFSVRVSKIAEKENLTEDALSGYDYELPEDKEQMLYDFYMSTLLFPPPTSGPGASLSDPDLAFTVNYSKEKLYKALQKELLDAVMFSLSAEIRHFFDRDNLANAKTILTPEEYKVFEKFAKKWSALSKYNVPPKERAELSPSMIRKSKDDYVNSYKAAMSADPKQRTMVEAMEKLYEKGKWQSSFGGKAWAKIANAWLKLSDAKDNMERMIWIDHVYDLQHNTDTVFNKIKAYTKGGTYGWIKQALDHKFKIKNPYEMFDKISHSMKTLAGTALKAWKGTTLEQYLRDNNQWFDERKITDREERTREKVSSTSSSKYKDAKEITFKEYFERYKKNIGDKFHYYNQDGNLMDVEIASLYKADGTGNCSLKLLKVDGGIPSGGYSKVLVFPYDVKRNIIISEEDKKAKPHETPIPDSQMTEQIKKKFRENFDNIKMGMNYQVIGGHETYFIKSSYGKTLGLWGIVTKLSKGIEGESESEAKLILEFDPNKFNFGKIKIDGNANSMMVDKSEIATQAIILKGVNDKASLSSKAKKTKKALLEVGDKVKVKESAQLMKVHAGSIVNAKAPLVVKDRYTEFKGELQTHLPGETVYRKFPDDIWYIVKDAEGNTWALPDSFLEIDELPETKEAKSSFKVGQEVKLKPNITADDLESFHISGSLLNDFQNKPLKITHISNLQANGDIQVQLGGNEWWLHPDWVVPVGGEPKFKKDDKVIITAGLKSLKKIGFKSPKLAKQLKANAKLGEVTIYKFAGYGSPVDVFAQRIKDHNVDVDKLFLEKPIDNWYIIIHPKTGKQVIIEKYLKPYGIEEPEKKKKGFKVDADTAGQKLTYNDLEKGKLVSMTQEGGKIVKIKSWKEEPHAGNETIVTLVDPYTNQTITHNFGYDDLTHPTPEQLSKLTKKSMQQLKGKKGEIDSETKETLGKFSKGDEVQINKKEIPNEEKLNSIGITSLNKEKMLSEIGKVVRIGAEYIGVKFPSQSDSWFFTSKQLIKTGEAEERKTREGPETFDEKDGPPRGMLIKSDSLKSMVEEDLVKPGMVLKSQASDKYYIVMNIPLTASGYKEVEAKRFNGSPITLVQSTIYMLFDKPANAQEGQIQQFKKGDKVKYIGRDGLFRSILKNKTGIVQHDTENKTSEDTVHVDFEDVGEKWVYNKSLGKVKGISSGLRHKYKVGDQVIYKPTMSVGPTFQKLAGKKAKIIDIKPYVIEIELLDSEVKFTTGAENLELDDTEKSKREVKEKQYKFKKGDKVKFIGTKDDLKEWGIISDKIQKILKQRDNLIVKDDEAIETKSVSAILIEAPDGTIGYIGTDLIEKIDKKEEKQEDFKVGDFVEYIGKGAALQPIKGHKLQILKMPSYKYPNEFYVRDEAEDKNYMLLRDQIKKYEEKNIEKSPGNFKKGDKVIVKTDVKDKDVDDVDPKELELAKKEISTLDNYQNDWNDAYGVWWLITPGVKDMLPFKTSQIELVPFKVRGTSSEQDFKVGDSVEYIGKKMTELTGKKGKIIKDLGKTGIANSVEVLFYAPELGEKSILKKNLKKLEIQQEELNETLDNPMKTWKNWKNPPFKDAGHSGEKLAKKAIKRWNDLATGKTPDPNFSAANREPLKQLSKKMKLEEYIDALDNLQETIVTSYEFTGEGGLLGKLKKQKKSNIAGKRVEKGCQGALGERRMGLKEQFKRAIKGKVGNFKAQAKGHHLITKPKKVINAKINPFASK